DLGDALEEKFRKANSLLWLAKAIKELHFPDGRKAWKEAHDRIVFDEFFYLQLRAALQFQFRKKVSKGRVLNFAGELLQRWEEALPYQLTAAQKKVISEIKEDLLKEKPMNRLLQGDVGSGKTEVALFSLLVAVQTGLQAAIMAPTEILAEQHYKKISARVNPLGVQVVYRVGSMLKKEREEADEKINNGEAQIVIGTHALLQEKVKFQDLGLVVIDEQHRFGVEQRLALIQKGIVPHTLIMTATPIPRTLALTFYGDLDKSVIDELPPGRIPIATKWIRENERNKLYDFAKKEIEKGQQVYIVYPLVEESEKVDLKAATESSKYLAEQVFNGYSVRLLHGKLKNKDKDKIMQEFREGKVQVLVATTVIEVGVDVPSASIMIIEHAERFGLAQLHQLRGRVGRGQAKAYCFLMGKPKTEEGKKRLAAMVQTTDGFKLAEVDLSLRGPGEFYGFRQSGIPDLNLADLIKDEPILLKARKLAQEVAEKDRELSLPEHYELKKELKRRLGDIWKMQVLN
ncbi:MAG: ATP-dependent DNA helicase RecG, partial [Candidatus Margulisbacteria bacterium]|nr:ATP-dependent DNA helicase RecG [Candidatus Margulisiibacteriota bacterium]